MENPLNYDLDENSESLDHVTNNVPNEEQDISPQLGTSSGKPTQVGNWNDAISMQTGLEIEAKMENPTTQRTDQNELTIQAEMEFDSSEGEDMPKAGGRVKVGGTTKAKRRVQGRFVFNTVAFPELLHELLDGKLTVTTRLGNTAYQWIPNSHLPDQNPMEEIYNYNLDKPETVDVDPVVNVDTAEEPAEPASEDDPIEVKKESKNQGKGSKNTRPQNAAATPRPEKRTRTPMT